MYDLIIPFNPTVIKRMRAWMAEILGPTAQVENYSDSYVVRRYRDMWGFYGTGIMKKWNAPELAYC